MIIVHTAGGRTGNQSLLLCHLIATAIEHRLAFINVSFRSSRYFKVVNTKCMRNLYSRCCVWILWRLFFCKFIHRILRFLGITFLTNTKCEPDSIAKQLPHKSKGRLLIMNVWPYSDYAAIYKHQDEVRRMLQPLPSYIKKADLILDGIQSKANLLVGIHIRRTDYKVWNDGIYFYEISKYVKHMRQMVSLCSSPIQFIVCSDETIEANLFTNIQADVYISRNDFMTDMVLLSKCNYIIGPPSTFASYASFYGNTPRFTIYPDTKEIKSLSEFGVSLIDYDDTFESYHEDIVAVHSRMHIILNKGVIKEIRYKS